MISTFPLRIDLAGLDQIEDALPLLQQQLAEHSISLPLASQRRGLLGLLDRPDRGAVLLARRGDLAVGIAILAYTWTVEHGGLVAWLDELFVVPSLRGQGIGGRMIEATLDIARGAGCVALELEVEASHSRAAALYERVGFRRLGRTRFTKSLAPAPR